jgi:DinB superfamily
VKRSLSRLDSVHQQLVDTVSSLEPKVFSQAPAVGQWSVAEIVHHLCLVEELVIKSLEGALARPPQRVGFFRRFIPTSVASIRLLKVKAPKAAKPFSPPEKEVALENFSRARSRLKELCATHGKNRLRYVIFKHPVLGEIDGVATVSFVGYHELRHFKQIREVLGKLKNGKRRAADSRG